MDPLCCSRLSDDGSAADVRGCYLYLYVRLVTAMIGRRTWVITVSLVFHQQCSVMSGPYAIVFYAFLGHRFFLALFRKGDRRRATSHVGF